MLWSRLKGIIDNSLYERQMDDAEVIISVDPHAMSVSVEQVSEFEWLAVGGPDPYDQMDLAIDDFDVVFAYPWPGEERVIERLFERFACDGALLITYNGTEGVRLFRRRAARAGR